MHWDILTIKDLLQVLKVKAFNAEKCPLPGLDCYIIIIYYIIMSCMIVQGHIVVEVSNSFIDSFVKLQKQLWEIS